MYLTFYFLSFCIFYTLFISEDIGPIKVNQKMAIWGVEIWKPGKWNISLGFELTENKVQNLGLTTEPCRKPKTNNQQLLRNKLKLKLKYEVNLRFETKIWKPGADQKNKHENEKLNSTLT